MIKIVIQIALFFFTSSLVCSNLMAQNTNPLENPVELKAIRNESQLRIDLGKYFGDHKPLATDFQVGIFFLPEFRTFYPTILGWRKNPKDAILMEAKGTLTYNADDGTLPYSIASKDPLKPSVNFSKDRSLSEWTGRIPVPTNISPETATFDWTGKFYFDTKNRKIETNLGVSLDISGLNGKAWDKMLALTRLIAMYNQKARYISGTGRHQLELLLAKNEKERKKIPGLAKFLKENGSAEAGFSVKKLFPSSLVLTNLQLQYNQTHKAFWGKEPVELFSINGEDVRRKMDAKVEYKFGKFANDGVAMSDTLRICLEVDPITWFYFEITDQKVGVTSSDLEGFNPAIKPGGKEPEVVRLKGRDRDRFLGRFIKHYLFEK